MSENNRLRVLPSRLWICSILPLAGAITFGAPITAKGQTPIQISAPAMGTIVSPGQKLNVAVSTSPTSTFSQVFVIAQNVDASAPLGAPPYSFALAIPSSGFFGPLRLTAVGVLGDGTLAFSQPTFVSVEPAMTPDTVSASPSLLVFLHLGQQLAFSLEATYADGTLVDLSHSPQVVYQSMDPTVAIVRADGTTIAIGPGTTNIRATYGSRSVLVPVTVPNAVRGDLTGDGRIDQDDLNILLDSLNQPAATPVDARDLNRDGVINALDSRILVTLCTRPACAMQ